MNTEPTTLTGAQLLEIAEAMKSTSRYTMRDERGKVISIIIVATGVNAAAVDYALEKAGLFIIETPHGH
jgi:hypothetical protein